MEIHNFPADVKVFGFTVKNFPAGIGEAFESLIQRLPGGFDRSYYGISYLDENGHMVYKATAAEKFESEAEKYNYEQLVIEKGEYLAVRVHDWRKNTDSIKNVFHEIMMDGRADKTSPAVEWYKNDDEMMCMAQTVSKRIQSAPELLKH